MSDLTQTPTRPGRTRPHRRDRIAVTGSAVTVTGLALAVAFFVVPQTVPLPEIFWLLIYASPWVLLVAIAASVASVLRVDRRARGRWTPVLLARAWLLAWTSFLAMWGLARVVPGAFRAESRSDPADHYEYGWPLRWVVERREQAAGGPNPFSDYGWDVLTPQLWIVWALFAAAVLAVTLTVVRLRRRP